jgi:cell division protein FtsQ
VARVAHLPSLGRAPRVATALLPSGRALLLAAALVLAGTGLYAGARATSVFAVRAVDVRGASAPIAREVREALAPFVGRSLLTLDGGDLVARLERIPAVAAAEYDRAFPHTLVVVVREERPAAVLRRGAEAWLVAASGRVLRPVPPSGRSTFARVWVPTDTPVALGGRLDERRAAGAVAAVARIPAGFPARVRDVRAGTGELTFKLVSGLELRLGDDHDVDLKLAVAARILPTLRPDGSSATPYLDVAVAERPVSGATLNSEVQVEG